MELNSKSIIEIIKSRISCRTFKPNLLDQEEKKNITDILRNINFISPFSLAMRISLMGIALLFGIISYVIAAPLNTLIATRIYNARILYGIKIS